MTKPNDVINLLDPMAEGYDLNDLKTGPVAKVDHGVDGHHLASILAFLGREVDQSAAMLRDLAGCLSHELFGLNDVDSAENLHQRLMASTIALQNEDRVQQRLADLRAALSVLEKALTKDAPTDRADLDHAVIDQLRLDETRGAFAQSFGMVDELSPGICKGKTPSLGDVDLF